jgi:hypothetical protein
VLLDREPAASSGVPGFGSDGYIAIWGLSSLLQMMKALYRWIRPPGRIHPYYERKLSEAETFLSGDWIAINLVSLEKKSQEARKLPLSSLKFSPLPISRKTLAWNSADVGIAVILDQLELASLFPESFENPDMLKTELERILLALREARTKKIRFTLVRKFGNYTNAMEWEDGGGSI